MGAIDILEPRQKKKTSQHIVCVCVRDYRAPVQSKSYLFLSLSLPNQKKNKLEQEGASGNEKRIPIAFQSKPKKE
jgi:hypothetical protein